MMTFIAKGAASALSLAMAGSIIVLSIAVVLVAWPVSMGLKAASRRRE